MIENDISGTAEISDEGIKKHFKSIDPWAAIFELVLKENNLDPSETLFIDDTASNLEEARKLGIHVHHLVAGTSITDIDLFQ